MVRDHLCGVPMQAVLAVPFPGAKLALDVDQAALAQVVGADLAKPAEGDHGVVLDLLLANAVLALADLRGNQAHVDQVAAGGGVVDLGVAGQAADQGDSIDHFSSSSGVNWTGAKRRPAGCGWLS